jgi:hypothetical protein
MIDHAYVNVDCVNSMVLRFVGFPHVYMSVRKWYGSRDNQLMLPQASID